MKIMFSFSCNPVDIRKVVATDPICKEFHQLLDEYLVGCVDNWKIPGKGPLGVTEVYTYSEWSLVGTDHLKWLKNTDSRGFLAGKGLFTNQLTTDRGREGSAKMVSIRSA